MLKIVRAFPVLPGKEAALDSFMRAMRSRAEEVDEFYRRYGVNLESWHVQTGPQGTLVIVTTELEDDASFAAHAESEQAFDRWFKEQVKDISGIALDETPRGEPSREAFCWKSKP